jgi:hypothetical protein
MEISPEIQKRVEEIEAGTIYVGITGTQDGMTEAQFASLKELIELLYMNEIHGGDCVGFDAECITLVQETQPEVKTVGHPPLDPKKRAFLEYDELREEKEYIERNHDIVDETKYLIACPNSYEERWRGSGTWATIRYARKLDRTIIIVWPDGKYTYENQSD